MWPRRGGTVGALPEHVGGRLRTPSARAWRRCRLERPRRRRGVPELERERRADRRPCSRASSPICFGAPPLLDRHRDRRAGAHPGGHLPQEPADRDHEREHQHRDDPEHRHGAAGDGAARPGGPRPAPAAPEAAPARRLPSADSRRAVRRLMLQHPGGAPRPPGPSAWAAILVGRHPVWSDGGRASSHDCRITAAAAASIDSRCALRRLPRRGVGLSEVALGDHRGEALIVGVDLHRRRARASVHRLDLREHRPRRRTELTRERAGQTDHDARRRPARWRRRGSHGGRRPGRPRGRGSPCGLASTPDGSVTASPMRRSPRSTPRIRVARSAHPPAACTAACRQRERVVDRATFCPPPCTTSACLAVPPPSAFAASRAISAADTPPSTRSLLTATARPALPSRATPDERDDAGAERVARGDGERAQVARRQPVAPDDDACRRWPPRPACPPPRARHAVRALASSSSSSFTRASRPSTRSGTSPTLTFSVSARPRSCKLFVVDPLERTLAGDAPRCAAGWRRSIPRSRS